MQHRSYTYLIRLLSVLAMIAFMAIEAEVWAEPTQQQTTETTVATASPSSANVQIPSAQPDQPTESAENLRTQALGYFYADDKAKALTIMDSAIKQFPNDAANYQLRGTFYGEMQNFPPAIADLRRATEIDPSLVDAWTNLGGFLLSNGDFAVAQIASAKAVELLPSYIATANLGHTYFLQGDRATARMWYAKSMQLLPNEEALRTGPLADFDWFITHNWQTDLSRAEQAWYAQEAKTVLSQSANAEVAKVALVAQRLAEKEAQFIEESVATISSLNAELSDIKSLEQSLGRNNPRVIRQYQVLSERFKYLAEGYSLRRYYVEAEPLYKQALTIGIQAFGNDSMEVADILRRIGASYQEQKRYAEASKLFARALEIKEKKIGRYHEDLFLYLMNLSACYSEQERFSDAEQLLKRVIAIGEQSKQDKLRSMGWLRLALIYQQQGSYVEADNAKLRADALTNSTGVDERIQGRIASQSFTAPLITNPAPQVSPTTETMPKTAPDMEQNSDASAEADRQTLSQAYQTLFMSGLMLLEQNNPVEADKVLQRELNIRAVLFGPNNPLFVDHISDIADSYNGKFLYSYAEPWYQRALTLSAKILGEKHPDHIKLLRKVASFYDSKGQYTKAETLYKQVLAVRQQIGANTLAIAESFEDLCSFYKSQGRHYDAEQLCRQALTTREHLLQPDHADISDNLRQLANIYRDVGRYTEAEALYQRARNIGQNLTAMFPDIGIAPGAPSTRMGYSIKSRGFSLVARANFGLASMYLQQKRYAEAEQLIKKAQDIYKQLYGPQHILTFGTLGKLAALYGEQKRYSDAEPLAKASLDAVQQAFGERHPYTLGQLTLLAKLYREQGRYADAEVLYKKAMDIAGEVYSTENINNVLILQGLANLYHKQGNTNLALEHIRSASRILRQYLTTTTNDRMASSMDNKHVTYKDALLLHLAILSAYQQKVSTASDTAEGFEIGQVYHDNAVGEALAEMAARSATGNSTLANLARQQQDTLHAYQKTDKNLIDLLSSPPTERNSLGEQNLRVRLAEIKKKLDELTAQLAKQFPDYMDLLNPKPITVAQVQQLLTPGEAIVAYALGEEQSFVWLVTPTSASFRQIDRTAEDIDKQVKTLRATLSPDVNQGLQQPFPVATAHALYQDILGPEAAHLTGIKTLFVVADGALESLPFAVLVTAAPTGDPMDYKHIAWLSRTIATATLPTVSSLRALRTLNTTGTAAAQPFIGFGNPDFGTDDNGTTTRSGKKSRGKTRTNKNRTAVTMAVTRGTMADPTELRKLQPLPETADELRAIAKTLGAGPKSVILGKKATVPAVTTNPLAQYRVVDFATHALVAGDIEQLQLGGAVEPAIVLTPPKVATADNDGLLRASQVAQLKLNADWVILSACNTAAPDGTPGAVGLSGLAKAFFYAGAKAMLVSHWSVASKPAVALTTNMFKIWQDQPELGRAEALRQAEMAVLDNPDEEYFAHPGAWAPFIVAGEGGGTATTLALLDSNTTAAPTTPTIAVDFAMLQQRTVFSKPTRIQEGDTLRSGDGYFFHLQTGDGPQNYLYVYQIDSAGKVFRLFPNKKYRTATNPISAHKRITLPNEGEEFFLDSTTGKEDFYFIASTTSIPALEKLERGTLADITNQGLKSRGTSGIRTKTATVAAPTGETKSTVQEFIFADNLVHSFSIKHE